MDEKENVVRGENNKNFNESSGMGKITPSGLPEHIRSLVLTFDTKNGNFQVAGCIGDKCLSFGMIELAKEAISEWNKNNKIPGVINP